MERVNIKIEGPYGDLPCIYRMQLGKTKKFFIWKTKNLKPSLPGLAKDLQRKIDKGCDDQDQFCKLASYMRANRVRNIIITVLVNTEDLVRLIHKEHEILAGASEDKRNCLNNSFMPYLPGWIKKELDEDDLQSVLAFVSNPGEIHQIEQKMDEPLKKVTAPSFFAPPNSERTLSMNLQDTTGIEIKSTTGIVEMSKEDGSDFTEEEVKDIISVLSGDEPEITFDDISAMAAKLRENK